jgi:hypothetical protein
MSHFSNHRFWSPPSSRRGTLPRKLLDWTARHGPPPDSTPRLCPNTSTCALRAVAVSVFPPPGSDCAGAANKAASPPKVYTLQATRPQARFRPGSPRTRIRDRREITRGGRVGGPAALEGTQSPLGIKCCSRLESLCSRSPREKFPAAATRRSSPAAGASEERGPVSRGCRVISRPAEGFSPPARRSARPARRAPGTGG